MSDDQPLPIVDLEMILQRVEERLYCLLSGQVDEAIVRLADALDLGGRKVENHVVKKVLAELNATEAAILESIRTATLNLESRIMSKLSDQIAALTRQAESMSASVDGLVDRVQADTASFNDKITTLQGKIDDLTAQIAAGNEDPVLAAQLDALQSTMTTMQGKVDAVDPIKPDVLPPEPGTTPEPTPEPTTPTDVTPPATDVTPPAPDMPPAPEPFPTPEPAPEPPPVDTTSPDGTS